MKLGEVYSGYFVFHPVFQRMYSFWNLVNVLTQITINVQLAGFCEYTTRAALIFSKFCFFVQLIMDTKTPSYRAVSQSPEYDLFGSPVIDLKKFFISKNG